MVYCMTETNLCPSRPEIWECSTNKGSATALPRYSSAICPTVVRCWTDGLGIHDTKRDHDPRVIPCLDSDLHVILCGSVDVSYHPCFVDYPAGMRQRFSCNGTRRLVLPRKTKDK